MKSKFIELGDDDNKAKEHILESLSICAHDHILSRKLLDRFLMANGPMFAIVGDWCDLNYGSGVSKMTMCDDTTPSSPGEDSMDERPIERLVAFIAEYLQTTRNAVVVCESWGADRKTYASWPWGEPPPVSCFRDNDVYHIVTPDILDPQVIENAVVERYYWQTGVCSQCKQVPNGDIPGVAFLDEIVVDTKHIFVPAFDGNGYLIWSPRGNTV